MSRAPKTRRFTARTSVRHAVATEAARLLYRREYKEYYQAKREAARRQGTKVLPTNQEIHRQILLIAEATEGEERTARLQSMREAAMDVMEHLADFRPRLIGSVWTGHIRAGSDIDLHLYSDDLSQVEYKLQVANLPYQVYHVQSKRGQKVMTFTHIKHRHRRGFEVEMTVYPEEEYNLHPTCSITGGPMARASVAQLRELLKKESSSSTDFRGDNPDETLQDKLSDPDRWKELLQQFPELLACQGVAQNHYHHLDVFDHTIEVCSRLLRLRQEGDRYSSLLTTHNDDLLEHLESPGPGGWNRGNLLLLAAFCHDLGKPQTQSFHHSGRIRFLGHESVGAGLARQVATRWEMQPQAALALERMVALHMEPVLIPSRDTPASVIHRFFRDAGDILPELLLLSWADVNSARGSAQAPYRFEEQLVFVREMMEVYFQRGFLRFPTLPVSAVDLEMEFGLSDVKLKSRLLERLTEDYVDGEFEGREDGLSWAAELLDAAAELW